MLMAEFLTAVRHGLPVKVFINNNASLGQILWEQMVLGYPEFGVRYRAYADFARVGRGLRRATASRSPRPATSRPRSARRSPTPGPALVDVRRQPRRAADAARKVTYEQAKEFAEAFLRGPAAQGRRSPRTLFRDKIAELELMSDVDAASRRRADGSIAARATSSTGGSSGRCPASPPPGRRVTGAEILLEHDRASFGNKMMWLPVALTPVGRGRRRRLACSAKRMAKTVLPLASAVVVANGLQGTYLHVRGIAQRPGRLARWPATTPRWGRRCSRRCCSPIVGGMGLLAAVLRRER